MTKKIHQLNIDLETYSGEDISKSSVYRYVEDRDFTILLLSVSIDEGPVITYDLACGDVLPDDLLNAIVDPNVTKWAFNANFERVCLSSWIHKHYPFHFKSYCDPKDSAGNYLDPNSWKCTMVWAAYLGLPRSLADVGAVLSLDRQKMTEGSDLIRYFCTPNKDGSINRPENDLTKWTTFKAYNKRDVEVELSIQKKLMNYPVPISVWEEYHIDQMINDRGIAVDMELVHNAIQIDDMYRTKLLREAKTITGLDNPNSVKQLSDWLLVRGIKVESMDKKAIVEILNHDIPDDVRRMLQIRQRLAKSSVKKYQAIENTVCADGRIRGLFQFYGANRTGRWAGRYVQFQNLPQTHMAELEKIRIVVKNGDYDSLTNKYDNVSDVLSELIRTAFISKPGYKFVVSDFSAIEARVLSWLAEETWRNDVFAENGDIYCASATAMFGVPVVKGGINSELRAKGKIAELALGYGGSTGALIGMGALEQGLTENDLPPLVDAWRTANPKIVSFWWSVDRAVKDAVLRYIPSTIRGIHFEYKSGLLLITLPSGRNLTYVKPQRGINMFGGECITYLGIGATKKWERINSYGPKFVENIVQAIARDLLCYTMKCFSGRFICGHVHDELIIECRTDEDASDISRQMSATPPWADGLVLNAEGFESFYYKKE